MKETIGEPWSSHFTNPRSNKQTNNCSPEIVVSESASGPPLPLEHLCIKCGHQTKYYKLKLSSFNHIAQLSQIIYDDEIIKIGS